MHHIDDTDRRLIIAMQHGMPLVSNPYHVLAESIGIDAADVMARIIRMLDSGIIRRIGAVPNHYALGYKDNVMAVWDVDDLQLDELGERIGSMASVSHCYHRPRESPHWPYNLFAMVHGRSREEVEEKVSEIDAVLGRAARSRELLYSTHILKKTGVRLRKA
jgi:DNA-binding Lrp family transcriptional regulator